MIRRRPGPTLFPYTTLFRSESASTTSSRVIMPRSPCPASAAWTKKAGVPVLASVDAILRAMCPDLPTPLTTTRRSEEHTSELQSQFHLVCRLLLEKKKDPYP